MADLPRRHHSPPGPGHSVLLGPDQNREELPRAKIPGLCEKSEGKWKRRSNFSKDAQDKSSLNILE